jgi:hypothetical protein
MRHARVEPAALGAIPHAQRGAELSPEHLEVDRRGELLQRIALC